MIRLTGTSAFVIAHLPVGEPVGVTFTTPDGVQAAVTYRVQRVQETKTRGHGTAARVGYVVTLTEEGM